MPVRKNAESRWVYQRVVHLPNGRKVRIAGRPTLNTRRAAEEAERTHVERTLNPPPAQKAEAPTFASFADRWWETYPASAGNKASTVQEKEIHLRLHIRPFFDSYHLDQITTEVVAAFAAQLAGADRHRPGKHPRAGKELTKLSRKTVRNVLQTLRKILASAQEWGAVASVPRQPKVKVPDPQWDFYHPEEARMLLAAARNDEDRALLTCALHTGMRAGELLALRWGDVDRVNMQVLIRRSNWRGEVGSTKSGRARQVPLTPTLDEALKRIRHIRCELVFCRLDGRALEGWQLTAVLEATARRAGLRAVRWHDLRHSYASQLVMAGVPIRRVQELLGHASINQTVRYSHLAPDTQNLVAKVLEGGVSSTAR